MTVKTNNKICMIEMSNFEGKIIVLPVKIKLDNLRNPVVYINNDYKIKFKRGVQGIPFHQSCVL